MNWTFITVEALIEKPIEIVWKSWTSPEHIVHWCFASDDWACPAASNDLTVGGTFTSTMAAKDGRMSFDFSGVYSEVVEYKKIAYGLADGRTVSITFKVVEGGVNVTETFAAENENPVEMQQAGWQAILNNFKKHTESLIG